MFGKLIVSLSVVAVLFATSVRLPAIVCPVASAPVGEACQMGCCANKCCCAQSVKSEQAPAPAAKQTDPNSQLIGDLAASATFVAAPFAVGTAQLGSAPVTVVISKTRPALLCTFLI
jgi:hypothetical protein